MIGLRALAAAAVSAALLLGGPIARAQQADAPAAPPAVTQPAAAPALPPADDVKSFEPGRAPPADPEPQDATPQDPAPAGQPVDMSAEEAASPSFGRSQLPHDLSPVGMFMNADWVVKAVMLGLAFASLLTWTIWLAKTLELSAARTKARRSLKALADARTLDDASHALGARKGAGPIAGFVAAADAEIACSQDGMSAEGVKERVASHLSRLEAQAGRKLAVGTGILATIGSISPFVGLFGTVWGIMNAFIGISNAQTTNLAVVAPGIAEALLATAVGLVAAIPAVMIYNLFARQIAGHRAMLADASSAVLRIVSRDLDRETAPRMARRAAE